MAVRPLSGTPLPSWEARVHDSLSPRSLVSTGYVRDGSLSTVLLAVDTHVHMHPGPLS